MSDTKRIGNAILCVFSGETDCAVAAFAETTEELKGAIVDNWTGDPCSEETQKALEDIAEHDFVENGDLRFRFEIGEARFSDVFTYNNSVHP